MGTHAEDVPPLRPGILNVVERGEDLRTDEGGVQLFYDTKPSTVGPNKMSSPAGKL